MWGEYKAERGRLFKSRSDMEDALDFIGWYNQKSSRELGISRNDAQQLYLAYHEGRGGYRRGTWKSKPDLQRVAKRVEDTARSTRHSSTVASHAFAATPGIRYGPSADDLSPARGGRRRIGPGRSTAVPVRRTGPGGHD